MIKRRTPAILITCAVVLLLTMITMNMTQYLRGAGMAQDIEAPNQETLQKMKDKQKALGGAPAPGSGVGKMMEMSFKGGPKTPESQEVTGNPETPSIQIPNARLYKPTFDPNTTSAQWYDDESYQKVNAEKHAGKRTELGGDDD